MRKSRKWLIIATALLVLGVGATIAYLVSSPATVKNTFTVGDVALTLTETTGEEYRMIPGTAIKKDPLVTVVGGSEECYVYVKLDRANGLDDYVTYALADGWALLGGFDGVYYRMVECSNKITRIN